MKKKNSTDRKHLNQITTKERHASVTTLKKPNKQINQKSANLMKIEKCFPKMFFFSSPFFNVLP